MNSDLLQKFLDKGLLDLGEDREKFNYIQSAAQDLGQKLLENRQHLASASSVVLGGELPDDDLILRLCKEAITNHWQTFGSRFPGKPIQLFRATLLQALASIVESESDASNSGVIYYTTCGLLPYFATGNSDGIFREFLSELAQRIEDEAAQSWTSPKVVDAQKIKYEEVALAAPNVDAKALRELLKNAIGPAGGASPNPNWPSSNTPEWLEHYGAASATAIGSAVTSVMSAAIPNIITKNRSDSQAIVRAYFDTQGAADHYRADLLYWKEALYSHSKKDSYRHLSSDGAIYWAARDLHERVPRFHPISVEYFLRETVRSAIGEKEIKKKLTFEQFIAAGIVDIEAKEVTPSGLEEDRLTPLQAIEAVAAKILESPVAASRIGIPSQSPIQRDEIAVLLFRDFQVRRLAGGK
jgi:hypothetical protein